MRIPEASGGDATCSGIDALRQAIPQSDQSFRIANLVLFIIFMVWLFAFINPMMWRFRNHPRFYKIRPFWMGALMTTCGTMFCLASFLRMYIPDVFPCALVVIGYIYTMQGLGAVFNLRALVFVVENELQSRMLKRQTALTAEEPVGTSVGLPSTVPSSNGDALSVTTNSNALNIEFLRPPTLSAVKAIVRVGMGIGTIDDVSLPLLSQVKRPAFLIYFLSFFLFFAALGIVLLFAIHPSLLLCLGCEPYDEIVVTAIALSVPDVVVLGRISYVGYKSHLGNDVHGVLQEFALLLAIAMPIVLAGMVLEIVDPGLVDLNHYFAWEYLVMLSGTSIVLICSVLQLTMAVRQDRKDAERKRRLKRERQSQATSLGLNMLDIILDSSNGNELGQQFEAFAARYYVIELVHFMKDVHAFQKYFGEKNDKWRLQKAKLLVNMYVRVGTEAEVNLADSTRKTIIEELEMVQQGKQDSSTLRSIFDEAFTEAERMLRHGVWLRFLERTVSTPVPGNDQVVPLA